MRTTRRGWAGRAVVVALDSATAGVERLGGFEHLPASAGDTGKSGLWDRKDR